MNLGLMEALIIIWIVIILVTFWKIFSKTGQAGALSLLMIIPLLNVIMLFVLAFGKWPIEKELEKCKSKLPAPE